jgi:hypothetical protein
MQFNKKLCYANLSGMMIFIQPYQSLTTNNEHDVLNLPTSAVQPSVN